MNVMAMMDASRVLGSASAKHGIRPCSFRFDPGRTERSIRRAEDGSSCVLLGPLRRPDDEVLLDMVDGILAAAERPEDWQLRRELLFTLMEAELLGD